MRKKLQYLVLVIMIGVVSIFGTSTVNGTSMETNYHDGSRIYFTRIYKNDRHDVIIFKHDDQYLLKRVIGLPGDIVTIDNNVLYVNGVILEETYIDENMVETSCINTVNNSYCTYTLAHDEYFVLGDNRNGNAITKTHIFSIDSRTIGAIDKCNIVAKAISK